MKLARLFLFVALLGSSALACAQDASHHPKPPVGGLVTLYRMDPILSTFCFTGNHAGGAVQDHHAVNHGAEIDFGNYRPGSFSAGVSTDSTGRIVDLGTSETLKQKYGYNETGNGSQGFSSIHREGTSLRILQRHGVEDGTEYQELGEGSQLLTGLRSLDSAPIAPGHIYLIHVVRTGDWAADIFVKLLVVAYQPDQSVTFRWETLDPE